MKTDPPTATVKPYPTQPKSPPVDFRYFIWTKGHPPEITLTDSLIFFCHNSVLELLFLTQFIRFSYTEKKINDLKSEALFSEQSEALFADPTQALFADPVHQKIYDLKQKDQETDHEISFDEKIGKLFDNVVVRTTRKLFVLFGHIITRAVGILSNFKVLKFDLQILIKSQR